MRFLGILLLLIVAVGCNHVIEDIVELYDNGQVKTIRKYDGKINEANLVEELQFYPDGKPAYVKKFENTKPHGDWKFWHKNGNVWSEGNYVGGLREGESFVYHENGNLFFKGFYINGKKHGIWIFYNDNGDVESQHEFKMGEDITPEAKVANNKNTEE